MQRFDHIGPAAGILTLALSGCQTTFDSVDDRIPEADLLSGEAIFGEAVAVTERPDIDILATNDSMRAFVAGLAQIPNKAGRLRRLLQRMRDSGYFEIGYDAYSNLSAREAFAEKRGNCLSYTSLLIALAREVGLEASYQTVDVPPDYDSVNGMVVLIKHVNARVDDIPGRGPVTLEFSRKYASGIHDRQVMGDRFAAGLHYSNLAFSDDMAGDERGSFVYLRKAIEMAPDNPDFWTNLGVFYARRGHFDHAIAGYGLALGLDGHHRPAIRGLANAYAALGQDAKSRFYQRRVAHSRTRDAYAYYTLAQRAHEAGMPAESLELVSQAIRLYRRDHRFYQLRDEIHDQLGNEVADNESSKRARTLARDDRSPAQPRSSGEEYPRAKVHTPDHGSVL